MNARGQCLCGAVKFTAADVHPEVHVCHCSMCRLWGGGPAFALAVGSVTFDGDDGIERYDSSDWAERGFCRRCGSGLFYRLKGPNQYFMLMGSFDDQSGFRLADEIYIDEKPPGYDFAGEHPRLTGEEFLASINADQN